MLFIVTKILVTASLIVLITEIAKRSDKWGGLVAALPVTTFLVLFWMYAEGAGDKKIASHIRYTLFFVLPTLPMFVLFPLVIARLGFWPAIASSVAITAICLYLFNLLAEPLGYKLF